MPLQFILHIILALTQSHTQDGKIFFLIISSDKSTTNLLINKYIWQTMKMPNAITVEVT